MVFISVLDVLAHGRFALVVAAANHSEFWRRPGLLNPPSVRSRRLRRSRHFRHVLVLGTVGPGWAFPRLPVVSLISRAVQDGCYDGRRVSKVLLLHVVQQVHV